MTNSSSSVVGMSERVLKHEDRSASLEAIVGDEPFLLLLCADGHGGAEAAELCHSAVLSYVVEFAAADPSAESLREACMRAFARIQADVLSVSRTAGATLTVVAINQARAELTVAHVGDSSALLVEATGETLLTAEHRLEDSAEERERARAAGAKLGRAKTLDGESGGPLRAFPGGLAVCRTIGDGDCPAASAMPYVSTAPFDAAVGGAVLIASDGVWDALPHAKAARAVRHARTAREAADIVVDKAAKARGLRDDISAVVAWLGTPAWDASLHESRASKLGKRLFGGGRGARTSGGGGGSASDSPDATSPTSTPPASHLSSPVASYNNLELLEAIDSISPEDSRHGHPATPVGDAHAEAGSPPSQKVVMKVNV